MKFGEVVFPGSKVLDNNGQVLFHGTHVLGNVTTTTFLNGTIQNTA